MFMNMKPTSESFPSLPLPDGRFLLSNPPGIKNNLTNDQKGEEEEGKCRRRFCLRASMERLRDEGNGTSVQ
jgi:hypothetical protein